MSASSITEKYFLGRKIPEPFNKKSLDGGPHQKHQVTLRGVVFANVGSPGLRRKKEKKTRCFVRGLGKIKKHYTNTKTMNVQKMARSANSPRSKGIGKGKVKGQEKATYYHAMSHRNRHHEMAVRTGQPPSREKGLDNS